MPSRAPSPNPAMNGALKRKREDGVVGGGTSSSLLTATSVASAPSKKPFFGTTHPILNHLTQTERYLKEKGSEKTFEEIVNYLSIQFAEKSELMKLELFLKYKSEKVTYNSKGVDGKGSFKYKPKIAVRTAEELKGFLQKSTDFKGVKFEDLKDGWPNCAETIDVMEAAGELLVVRDKRQVIRTVWQDDPTLRRIVKGETKRIWDDTKLPVNADDLRSMLQAAGLKSTSGGTGKVKPSGQAHRSMKRKAPRKGGRLTNTHMIDKLNDYSEMRYKK